MAMSPLTFTRSKLIPYVGIYVPAAVYRDVFYCLLRRFLAFAGSTDTAAGVDDI